MTRSATGPSFLEPDVCSLAPPERASTSRHRSHRPPAAARAVMALLKRLQHGQLTLLTPHGEAMHFGHGEPRVTLSLKNWKPCQAALSKGDIGFAQSWIDGDWETDSLPRLLELFARNRTAIDQAIYGGLVGRLIYRVRHLLRRNDRAGSRRNIHAHYDLGNSFYARWLDQSMTYSSAIFGTDTSRDLEAAQTAKYQRILETLDLPANAHILEIGCGWGGFAEHAARQGMRVTGLTLSTEQQAWAQARINRAGLSERVEFRLQDYRDEPGRYDAVVSIEMFEAVGEAYWPTYFESVAQRLHPGGRALIQTITIADELFDRYRRGSDFIQQYIFPGGMLPSPSAFESQARQAGLSVTDRFAFGADYALTLACWRQAFTAAQQDILSMGFDRRFIRTWDFYLAYCEAGFSSHNTDVMQYTLQATGASS